MDRAASSLKPSAAEALGGARRPRILLLGSSADVSGVVAESLTAAYDVTCAQSPESALERARFFRPDLALVELSLSSVEPETFAHSLRSELNRPDLPLLVLCEPETESRTLLAIERGVDDYLALPFSSQALLTRVRTCLRRAQRFEQRLIGIRRSASEHEPGESQTASGLWSRETALLNGDSSENFSADSLAIQRESGKLELSSDVMARILEQKRAQAALAKAAQDQLRDAVEHLDAGLIMLDGEHRVLVTNQRFYQMYGVPHGTCERGTHIGDVIRAAAIHDPARFAVLLEGGSVDALIQARIEALKNPGDPTIQRLGDSWLRITDRRTSDGGTVSLSLDVTPYMEMETRLRQAVVSAEAGARAKSDFLATMSHEIRTPMNGVIGMANLLVKTKLDPEQREFAETIRSCGESLLVLINDVLDFSKMEAGKLELESVVFPLHHLVEEGVLLFAEEAEKKSLRIVYSFGANLPPRVKGDPTRVRQILLNLVSNAVKFTHQGQVEITVKIVDNRGERLRLAFEVTDSGIGMTAEQVAKVGQAFAQADVSMTRRYGGTGLGLSICSRLAELMAGKISASSVPGRGTTFRAELELGAVDGSVVETSQGLEGKRISIVVADPDAAARWLELCRLWGMRASVCRDASELISHLKLAERQDLALIDQDLPGIDGLMLARVLRADLRYRALPVLMVSGREPPGAEELRHIGITALLERPLHQGQLLEAMYQVFRPDLVSAERRWTIAPGRPLSRVLVAEDNPINQRLMMLLLRTRAEHVDYVSTGAEAVRYFVHGNYDCVLMDCQMPEMDGYQATRRIREFERASARVRTPIIAMTANALAGDREACLEAGMDEYLSKPLRADDLAAVLGGLVQPRISHAPSVQSLPQSWLDRLRESVGTEVAEELRAMGLTTLQALLDDARAAADAHDLSRLGRVAHAANGAAGALCLDDLRAKCVKLERAARTGDEFGALAALSPWIESMRQVLGWLGDGALAPNALAN